MNRLVTDFIFTTLAGALLLLWSGCVIAPVPLVENDEREVWKGRTGKIWDHAIVERQKQWYMPMVFSPEGPAKMRSITTHYSYYLLSYDSKQRVELPFLQMDSDNGVGGWSNFETPRNTTYIMARRIVRSKDSKNHDPTLIRFEFIVFERDRLICKHVFDAARPPGSMADSYWNRLSVSTDYRTVDYNSAHGPRRYQVVENTDEPLMPEDEAK